MGITGKNHRRKNKVPLLSMQSPKKKTTLTIQRNRDMKAALIVFGIVACASWWVWVVFAGNNTQHPLSTTASEVLPQDPGTVGLKKRPHKKNMITLKHMSEILLDLEDNGTKFTNSTADFLSRAMMNSRKGSFIKRVRFRVLRTLERITSKWILKRQTCAGWNPRLLVCELKTNCNFNCQIHRIASCLFTALRHKRTMVFPLVKLRNKRVYAYRIFRAGKYQTFLPLANSCVTKDENGEQAYKWVTAKTFPEFRGGTEQNETGNHQVLVMSHKRFDSRVFESHPVPTVFADVLRKYHPDPEAWWRGQIMTYILRPLHPTPDVFGIFKKKKKGRPRPVIGLEIIRGKKSKNEAPPRLSDYMEQVNYALTNSSTRTIGKVFVTSDDSKAVEELKDYYRRFNFFTIPESIEINSKRSYRQWSREGVNASVTDMFLLAHCDHVVCTSATSGVCPLSYALMQRCPTKRLFTVGKKLARKEMEKAVFYPGLRFTSRDLIPDSTSKPQRMDVVAKQ